MKPAVPRKIFILCGEPSGDRYAGQLAGALRKIDPDIILSGVGGNQLEKEKVPLLFHISSLSFSGFTSVIRNLFSIFFIRRKIIRVILSHKPDVVIMIDFPDFHISVARSIKKHSRRHKLPAPVFIYYIPPQIWIWRKNRIRQIKRFFDAVIPAFEFEKELYARHGIPVFFSGHPIIDCLQGQCQVKITHEDTLSGTITLLPGSREHEVKSILPLMLKCVHHYSLHHAKAGQRMNILIPVTASIKKALYEKILAAHKKTFRNPLLSDELTGNVHESVRSADVVLCKPGTNNLEIAFYRKPFIVIYNTNRFNWLMIRLFVRTRFASLINILNGRQIIREFIQSEAKPESIAEEINRIYNDPAFRNRIRTGLMNFCLKTGFNSRKQVSEQNAEFILTFSSRTKANG